MKRLLGIIGFLAIFVLAVSFVGAQSNNSTNTFNLGNCINDVAKIKNGCYNSSKTTLNGCKAVVRNQSEANGWGMFHKERRAASKVCNEAYKGSMNECKKAYKDSRNNCKNTDKARKAEEKARRGK